MKKAVLILISGFLSTLFMVSCGGRNEPASVHNTPLAKDTAKTAVKAATPYADLPPDVQGMMPRGEAIYKAKCVVCHQADGRGVESMFPPLVNSDFFLDDRIRAVAQVLNGSKKELNVNGKTYKPKMGQQVDTKEDAIAVVNYCYNNFGNKNGSITLAEVGSVKIDPRRR